jgi:hypothetical protein
MPTDMTRYPAHWPAFSAWIRFARAHGQCECTGECRLHRAQRSNTRCLEQHGHKAHFARGRVILTTAHLCKCDPPCANPGHVKAMCQRCHLRVDAQGKADRRRCQVNLTPKTEVPLTIPTHSLTLTP